MAPENFLRVAARRYTILGSGLFSIDPEAVFWKDPEATLSFRNPLSLVRILVIPAYCCNQYDKGMLWNRQVQQLRPTKGTPPKVDKKRIEHSSPNPQCSTPLLADLCSFMGE